MNDKNQHFSQQSISLETYAWGTSYDSFEDGKFLAALLKSNIKLRISKNLLAVLENIGKQEVYL